jgi:hypothetical protein
LTGSNNGQETISTRKTRYQQRSKSMMKRHKLAAHILFLLVLLNCIALLFIFAWIILLKPPKTPPSEVFRRYVLAPIPESVTNIRADQPKNIGGYRYTFRFNINRDDLALLINSRPFIKVWNVKYEDGSLNWAWDRDGPFGTGKYNSGIICYKKSARKPGWFKLGLWDNPEAYAFWKEGDLVNVERFGKKSSGPTYIRVLLYNEKEGEAYFIVSRFRS